MTAPTMRLGLRDLSERGACDKKMRANLRHNSVNYGARHASSFGMLCNIMFATGEFDVVIALRA